MFIEKIGPLCHIYNIKQNKKFTCINNNCSYIGNICLYFILWEGQGHFWGDKDQLLLGRAKGRGKRGYGEKPKMRVMFAKFPLFSKIQTLSHKLLVRQTSNQHHCNWHAQKPVVRDF